MSGDTQYRHRLWHLEDATLRTATPTLELLVDFDAPSRFARVANGPVLHGIHTAHPPCTTHAAAGAALAASSSSGSGKSSAACAAGGGGRRAAVLRPTLTSFGRLGASRLCADEPLVMQWRELGVPALTDMS